MNDFYNKNDEFTVFESDMKRYKSFRKSLTEKERKLIDGGYNFYEIDFENIGGLVMPVILKFNFKDGTSETQKMPAEIWLKHEQSFTKVFAFQKEVTSIELDPNLETADTERDNNHWPEKQEADRFKLYKQKKNKKSKNPMQKAG